MPNILSLKHKVTGKIIEGRGLIPVDEALCAALNVTPDEVDFFGGWVDRVGLALACGASWAEVRKRYAHNEEMMKVIEYLQEHYDNNSYAEIGRR